MSTDYNGTKWILEVNETRTEVTVGDPELNRWYPVWDDGPSKMTEHFNECLAVLDKHEVDRLELTDDEFTDELIELQGDTIFGMKW